jgi:hypothetical protein
MAPATFRIRVAPFLEVVDVRARVMDHVAVGEGEHARRCLGGHAIWPVWVDSHVGGAIAREDLRVVHCSWRRRGWRFLDRRRWCWRLINKVFWIHGALHCIVPSVGRNPAWETILATAVYALLVAVLHLVATDIVDALKGQGLEAAALANE